MPETGNTLTLETTRGPVVIEMRPDLAFLDRQYTVWGKVTSGMENVDKIKCGEAVRDPDRIISSTVS